MTKQSAHNRSAPRPPGTAHLSAFLNPAPGPGLSCNLSLGLSLTLSLILAMASTVQAQTQTQTLTLFEDVETVAATPNAPQRMVVSAQGAPQFTLVGTSQLGDRRHATLRTASGETVKVELNAVGATPIPGYPGYRIDEAGYRHLVVQHPASAPCFEALAQGVSCADDSVARLQLVTAQAVQPVAVEEDRRPRRGRQQPAIEGQEAGLVRQEARRAAPPDNPFAAALRAARERGDVPPAPRTAPQVEGERFQPRRIDPSQVPEGARLVRTPFGDRIVRD